MFTGIVEEVGAVLTLDTAPGLTRATVEAPVVAADLGLGDSIAVNGACLTVTQRETGLFSVEMVAETLRRTNLGDLEAGEGVNLERPLAANGRLGGHFVQGHVDTTGMVAAVRDDGEALDIRIEVSKDLRRYIVEKGFITVDGASLTVTRVDAGSFHIALIPYSQTHLAKNIRTPGKRVNLEVDILAKYVEKLLIDSGGRLYAT